MQLLLWALSDSRYKTMFDTGKIAQQIRAKSMELPCVQRSEGRPKRRKEGMYRQYRVSKNYSV